MLTRSTKIVGHVRFKRWETRIDEEIALDDVINEIEDVKK